ncbi:hypothetical protein PMAC_001861 [Pneumocystis sp. 'macacae']|nr:hypothetical protein PMAC_001861 [Pneumocystis sp. 'macacae']
MSSKSTFDTARLCRAVQDTQRSTSPIHEEDSGFQYVRTRRPESLQKSGFTRCTKENSTDVSLSVCMRALPEAHLPQRPLLPSHVSGDTLLSFSTHISRSTDSFVELPISDTPVIEKNRDLRQRRRSSLGFRGKRASSILSNGLIGGLHESFFKHISEDLPEAVRMKQLLIWCAKRALEDHKMNGIDDIEKIGRDAEAALLGMKTVEGEESKTSWYNREEEGILAKAKPHPRNVENRKKMKEFEEKLRKLKEEIERWNRLEAAFLSSGEKFGEKDGKEREGIERIENIDNGLEGKEKDESVLDKIVKGTLLESEEIKWVPPAKHGELRGWIESVEAGLEFKVDQLYHTMYSIESFGQLSNQYATRLLSRVARAIEERKRQAEIESGSSGASIRDVLRAITRHKG